MVNSDRGKCIEIIGRIDDELDVLGVCRVLSVYRQIDTQLIVSSVLRRQQMNVFVTLYSTAKNNATQGGIGQNYRRKVVK